MILTDHHRRQIDLRIDQNDVDGFNGGLRVVREDPAHDRGRLPVWERQEDEVRVGQDPRICRHQRAFGQRHEVGVHRAYGLPRPAAGSTRAARLRTTAAAPRSRSCAR